MGDDRMLTILCGGDVMLGRGVNATVRKEGAAHPFASLTHVSRRVDLFMANLECALSTVPRRYGGPPKAFYFIADPRGADVLTHAGIGLVSLANNHALDADVPGLGDTLRLLESANIAHAGAGMNEEEAKRPAIVERSGVRLGLLSCCDHQADFSAGPDRPGIWYLNLEEPFGQVSVLDHVEALANRVDHLIVALHWQPNWAPVVPSSYRRLARSLVDAGARIVWGHSPHHFQGVEWMGSEAVTLYSAGDLVTDYAVDPGYRNDRQLLFEVTLAPGRVTRIRALPVELGYAETRPALGAARKWVARRFGTACGQVGSQVHDDGEWLEVWPARQNYAR